MKAILEKTEIDEISPDPDMIKSTLTGDRFAFGELVSKYQKKVYRLAYRIIGNPTDSADIVQETFVHAYQNLRHLKNHEKFQQWLCQIAKNQCFDWIRKRQDNLVAIEDELISDSLYLPPAPDEILIEQELYDQVMKAIEDLPEHNRKVVKMFYLDGKSYSEIQNELGITKGTLGRWLYEARLELIKASKHFAGVTTFWLNDCMSHLSKIFASTSAITATKCLVISIALHLIIFAQLSGNGIGYHKGKANQYNSLSTHISSQMSVEYIPIYSQLTPKISTFSKRDNVPKQKAMMDSEKKIISLQTIRQYAKSPGISRTQNSILVPLPQHNINMRYDNPSLTYGKSLRYEKNSINSIRVKGNAKPFQLISSKVLPVSNGLSEMKTDETQKPNISTKIESENDSEHYVLVRSWPEKPSRYGLGGKFAVDNSGNIYFSSSGNVIMKYSSDGKLLKTWGEKGSGDGQFRFPIGIAVDSSGNVYVADSGNFRIQKFDSEGKFLTKFGKKGYGNVKYNEPYAFKNPVDVAVDKNGNVYVVDSGNHCIHRFDSDGVWRHRWGERGSRDGQFGFPTCVAVDDKGNVYVADRQFRRIQKFTSDGEFLGKKLSSGSRMGSIRLTAGMATDNSGNLFIADTLNRHVLKLDGQLQRLAGWGQVSAGDDPHWMGGRKPEPDDGLILPSDIAVDKDGNVYVLDSWRIKIFRQASK